MRTMPRMPRPRARQRATRGGPTERVQAAASGHCRNTTAPRQAGRLECLGLVSEAQAATLQVVCFLAVSTSVSNVVGSSIAIWLSILRFSRMQARDRPLMNTL